MERQDIVPNSNSKLLRTVLTSEVHTNLTDYAKSIKTGRGDWDYGVAIQRLLELKDVYIKQTELECRIEELEIALMDNKGSKNSEQASNLNPHGLIGKNKTVRKDEN